MKNKYLDFSDEEQEELLSNFLIDHWSISSVRTFQRNEKVFEMNQIYKEYFPGKSQSMVVGIAYHKALEAFFTAFKYGYYKYLGYDEETGDEIEKALGTGKKGCVLSFDDLTVIAYKEIERVKAINWKVPKSKTIEKVQLECIKKTNFCIESFLAESEKYLSVIKEIVSIEVKSSEWVVLNGVHLHLPITFICDLIFIDTDGFLCVLDHKTKGRFTDDSVIQTEYSQQAIGYTIGIDAQIENGEYDGLIRVYPNVKEGVRKFYFYENKTSKNRDGSAQIVPIVINLDANTRRLYEAMFYEPVQRMIKAVNDPDYVYLINKDDGFMSEEEKCALQDFWIKTQISEISEFENLSENQKKIMERTKKIKDSSLKNIDPKVIKNFQKYTRKFITYSNMTDMTISERIEHRLKTLNAPFQVVQEIDGYSCRLFLMEPKVGIASNKLFNYRLDIANAVGSEDVRIGSKLIEYQDNNGEFRTYMGVEVAKRANERKFIDWSENFQSKENGIGLGLDTFGNPILWNPQNHSTPHLLIGGATGTGKSVAILGILKSINFLYPEAKVIIFDPKYEFGFMKDKAEVYSDIEEIEIKMEDLVHDMNNRIKQQKSELTFVIFDEFADAMQSMRNKKELDVGEKTLKENNQIMLQKGRSAGFRFIEATQRPSAKIVDGDAKANFATRLCFTLPKQIDSMVILDEEGAEKLCGAGDFLFTSPNTGGLVRGQGFYTE